MPVNTDVCVCGREPCKYGLSGAVHARTCAVRVQYVCVCVCARIHIAPAENDWACATEVSVSQVLPVVLSESPSQSPEGAAQHVMTPLKEDRGMSNNNNKNSNRNNNTTKKKRGNMHSKHYLLRIRFFLS